MFFNPLVFPTLAAAAGLYALGRRSGPDGRVAGALGAALCAPALLFLGYYLHLVRTPAWYVEFRGFPFVECLSALPGLLCGAREPGPALRARWPAVRTLLGPRPFLRLAIGLAFIPFAKAILFPVAWRSPLRESWQDGVCLQSSMATCGPCSTATMLRALGLPASEQDAARAAFTSATGTEVWYLLRYARRRGASVRVRSGTPLEDVAAPAVLGVTLGPGGPGHFISLLGRERGRLVVGDPLSGRALLTPEQFAAQYAFAGTAFEFSRPRS